jgi:hypothetical protein
LVARIEGAKFDPPVNADGDQTSYSSNVYVLIVSLPQFDRVIAASTFNSFEFDNVVAGGVTQFSGVVPETSTWAMMLVGSVGLGYAALRRYEQKSSSHPRLNWRCSYRPGANPSGPRSDCICDCGRRGCLEPASPIAAETIDARSSPNQTRTGPVPSAIDPVV